MDGRCGESMSQCNEYSGGEQQQQERPSGDTFGQIVHK